MELEFKGGNCVVIGYKKETFVIDPRLSNLGAKDQGSLASVCLLTQSDFAAPVGESTLVIDGPGEYEVHNCSVRGIGARRHSELDEKAKRATIYRLDIENISVAVLGHIDPKLAEDQMEAIGVVDIVILPVGGNGYTLDPKDAVDLIRKIDPKIVIPTHYAESGLTYEVPQLPLEDFTKEFGGNAEELPKLKLKAGALPASLTLYHITRTK